MPHFILTLPTGTDRDSFSFGDWKDLAEYAPLSQSCFQIPFPLPDPVLTKIHLSKDLFRSIIQRRTLTQSIEAPPDNLFLPMTRFPGVIILLT